MHSHSSVSKKCFTLTNSISVICDVDSHFASLDPKGSPRDLSVSPRGKPLHQRPESRKQAGRSPQYPASARASWTFSLAVGFKFFFSWWTDRELWGYYAIIYKDNRISNCWKVLANTTIIR